MERSFFHIKDMDCPSEEQIIRMKLAGIKAVKKLEFDLEKRNLTVYHDAEFALIKNYLDSLNFGAKHIETAAYDGKIENSESNDKKLLWTVLIINFSVFAVEICFGIIAHSMGLVADALDELSDAFVYGLSIYAITGTVLIKKRVAKISGILQLLLAIWGFSEIINRFIGNEFIPNSVIMIVLSCVALAGNVTSLTILNKSRTKEAHIRASQICTSNDIIANIGVIVAAMLVAVFQTKIPDLVVGFIVFIFVFRGSVKIIRLGFER
ncbi:MAG: cation transporter [Chitinivibrionia bacterium]|nr:cation transporter [Chitinivibrionia bacterium]